MKFYQLLIFINTIVIPITIFGTPLIMSPIIEYQDLFYDQLSDELKNEVDKSNERWNIIIYTVPPILTNLIGITFWVLFLRQKKVEDNETKSM